MNKIHLTVFQERRKVAPRWIFGWNNFALMILGSYEFFICSCNIKCKPMGNSTENWNLDKSLPPIFDILGNNYIWYFIQHHNKIKHNSIHLSFPTHLENCRPIAKSIFWGTSCDATWLIEVCLQQIDSALILLSYNVLW